MIGSRKSSERRICPLSPKIGGRGRFSCARGTFFSERSILDKKYRFRHAQLFASYARRSRQALTARA
nr:MAG TPA: hypothetical protein [Bacteriophage sp.]